MNKRKDQKNFITGKKMTGRRIKIAVCGSQDEIEIVIENLISTTESFELVASDRLAESDVVLWLYGKGPSVTKNLLVWFRKDPLIINQWIGSDVAGEKEKRHQRGINRILTGIFNAVWKRKLQRGGLINLTSAPWLVDELSALGIPATSLPITTIDKNKLGTIGSQPVKDIDFLSYVRFGRFDFYGGDKIVKLAKRWPQYTFMIICKDLQEVPCGFTEKMPKNLTVFPRVPSSEMYELYKRSKFFLRYTEHDAVSLSVLEALYFNLQVLWTYDFPYTMKIGTYDALSGAIPVLVETWRPNEGAHAWVVENFSVEKWRKDFSEVLQASLNPGRT
jgi:hypothetical protein